MSNASDHAPQAEPNLLPETVVREIVRLVCKVADLQASRSAKRKALMTGLARMVDADAWAWIISRAADDNNNPAVASYQHGGFSEQQFEHYVQFMQDRKNPPVEYAALNELRRRETHFTRRWDQLVSPEVWYGPRNRSRLALGFEHVMYSVRVLDDDGLFSGIALKRKTGRENFSPLEQRIVHIVTGEIDWLHHADNLSEVTAEIRPLSPRRRTVLLLLMEGLDQRQISDRLGCHYETVREHVKAIHSHFRVHSTRQLFRHFMAGDGHDVN